MITTVKMSDGRSVDFPDDKRLQTESFEDDANGEIKVRLDFLNGETRMVTLDKRMLSKYMAYGAEQKLRNEMIGLDDIGDAIEAVDSLIRRLNVGDWR